MNVHLDEFTLLRFAARDLTSAEVGSVQRHLAACGTCSATLASVRVLDGRLRALAESRGMGESEQSVFAGDDPFRSRPAPGARRRTPEGDGAAALAASELGLVLHGVVLEAAKSPEALRSCLADLLPERMDHRFGALYALQEASRRSAEDPFSAMRLGEETLRWLRERPLSSAVSFDESAERVAPRAALRAQANVLLGVGRLWTKEYAKAERHFAVAYRLFGRVGADLTSLAIVELGEAQRRALAGQGATALSLARRAGQTFEEAGIEDYFGRAMVVEGLALDRLDRGEEAVESCRRALPLFERYELWSTYISSLNCLATFLIRLGRVDEARREFARALRRFSQQQHRYWLGYIRVGLAEALFAARHFSEAAVSASRAAKVFFEGGLRAHSLIAMLLEVECWARSGSLDRARRRLELFWVEIDREEGLELDPVVVRELGAALSGADPNYETLSSLRSRLSDLIQDRYRAG